MSEIACPLLVAATRQMHRKVSEPWLEWLNGLSAGLRTKGSLDHFPVRAHAWVVGGSPVGGAQEATTH